MAISPSSAIKPWVYSQRPLLYTMLHTILSELSSSSSKESHFYRAHPNLGTVFQLIQNQIEKLTMDFHPQLYWWLGKFVLHTQFIEIASIFFYLIHLPSEHHSPRDRSITNQVNAPVERSREEEHDRITTTFRVLSCGFPDSHSHNSPTIFWLREGLETINKHVRARGINCFLIVLSYIRRSRNTANKAFSHWQCSDYPLSYFLCFAKYRNAMQWYFASKWLAVALGKFAWALISLTQSPNETPPELYPPEPLIKSVSYLH